MKKICLLGIAMMAMSISLASGSEKEEMTRVEAPVVQKSTQKSTTQKSTTQKSTLNPKKVKRIQEEARRYAEITANNDYQWGIYSKNLDKDFKSDFKLAYGRLPTSAEDKQYYEIFKKTYREHYNKSMKILKEM